MRALIQIVALHALLGASLNPALLVGAEAPAVPRPLMPLTGPRPLGPDTGAYAATVKDNAALVALGKALFWDVEVGGANGHVCASCHSHAGADTRITNQLSPGLNQQPQRPCALGDHLSIRSVG